MPNITHSVERYEKHIGAESADLRIRVRYCREQNYLPSSARKITTPQIELVQAVVLFLVHGVAGVQTTAVERMHKLWHLPLNTSDPVLNTGISASSGDFRPSTTTRDMLAGLNAGQALAVMIQAEISPVFDKDRLFTPSFPSQFPTISVSHKADWIKLWGNERENVADVWFCSPKARLSVPFGTGCMAPFISSTTILTLALWELANLVRESRAEAVQQNTFIPVEAAYEALGSAPLNERYWRDRLHRKQALSSNAPSVTKTSKYEDAETVPTAPASSNDQPRNDTQAGVDTTREIRKLTGADHNPRVCLSSTRIGSEAGTPSNRRQRDDPTSHHYALL